MEHAFFTIRAHFMALVGIGPFEVVRQWTDYLSISHSPRTVRAYKRTFVNFCADTLLDPREVTEEDLVAYLASVGPHGSHRADVLRAVRSFYGWAERYLERNPASRLKTPHKRLPEAPTLEDEELVRLLVAAAWREPRRGWAILLAYATGARAGSLCELTPADCHGEWIRFRVTKGDRPYRVPKNHLAAEAVKELEALREERLASVRRVRDRQDKLIGVGRAMFHNWVQAAGEDAGIKAWPHLLRHTAATKWAEAVGMDERTWIELMNHSDGSQLRRYAAPNEARLRSGADALDSVG